LFPDFPLFLFQVLITVAFVLALREDDQNPQPDLASEVEKMGMEPYRAEQLWRWIYGKGDEFNVAYPRETCTALVHPSPLFISARGGLLSVCSTQIFQFL
jgi:hypothetical protein